MKFGNKFKAITFSFDDGNLDDIRLVSLLNKYGLKSTFNLNSGKLSQDNCWTFRDTKLVQHINYTEHPHLYDGHEVACHSYTHPHLEQMERQAVDNQIRLDKKILECLYGYPIRGMAYPYGTYNDTVLEILRENGIEYSRVVKATHSFELPDSLLEWKPTCHFMAPSIRGLAEEFVNCKADQPMLFYIWGHSYELMTEEDWQQFAAFCQFIAHREDICYCTNIEVVDYMKA